MDRDLLTVALCEVKLIIVLSDFKVSQESSSVFFEVQVTDIGVEVKYTERADPLKKGSSEEAAVQNPNSRYFQVMEKCMRYKPGVENQVVADEFRQVWRNHLLGESMVLENPDERNHFHSITIYPDGNKHFQDVIPAFQGYMLEGRKNVLGLTIERFLQTIRSVDEESELTEWLEYMENRYTLK